jgi:hypothetical protein
MQMRTQMKNALRRLRMLERLPQFQPPPSVPKQILDRALQQMSNDDLELLKNMVRDSQAGVGRTPSERESAMLAEQGATLDTEARRMGFKSFAEAERKAR